MLWVLFAFGLTDMPIAKCYTQLGIAAKSHFHKLVSAKMLLYRDSEVSGLGPN